MSSNLLIRLCLSVFLLIQCSAYSQNSEDVLFVYGTTTEYHTGAEMPLVHVRVMKDGEELHALRSGNQGRYEIVLDLGFNYQIFFEKEGFFPKNYIIDSTGMTDEQKKGGFTFDVDMSLIPKTKGLEIPNSNDPISIATFDEDLNTLSFDAEMAQKYVSTVESALNKRGEHSK